MLPPCGVEQDNPSVTVIVITIAVPIGAFPGEVPNFAARVAGEIVLVAELAHAPVLRHKMQRPQKNDGNSDDVTFFLVIYFPEVLSIFSSFQIFVFKFQTAIGVTFYTFG